jgi:hypothetical protein
MREHWDPKAIVEEMTPQAFTSPPSPPEEEKTDDDETLIEQRYGLTARAAAQMALSQASLFDAEELETLELAARRYPTAGRQLFPLIQRFFSPAAK